MLPWIALPLCAFVALIALPVRVGFLKLPGAPLRVGVSLGPLRRQAALTLTLESGRPALRLTSGGGEKLIPLLRQGKRGTASKAPGRAFRFLIRRFRADRLDADVAVDAGDAAATAVLSALLGAGLDALAAIRPSLPLRRRVACSFNRAGAARIMGVFSARAGDIVLALLVFSREICFGRIRTWTSTPSKAS